MRVVHVLVVQALLWQPVISKQCTTAYNINQGVLTGHVLQTLSLGFENCVNACASHRSCYSINSGLNGDFCQLNNATHLSHPDAIVPESRTAYLVYFLRPYPRCSDSLCNEQNKCVMNRDGNGFHCVAALQIKSACENTNLDLRCVQGRLTIQWAKYGRSSSTICRVSSHSVCGDVDRSLSKMQQLCNGNVTCQVDASNHVFAPDPCYGTRKYLEVRYFCD